MTSQSTIRRVPALSPRASSLDWDTHHGPVRNRRRLIPAWEQRAAYDLLGIGPGERAVDLGCGVGHWTRVLAGWGLEVTGYDFSEVALTYAREGDVERQARYVDWDIDGEATPSGIVPGSVDLVTCRLSLEYLDSARLLHEVRRWLTPGRGRFYALVRIDAGEAAGRPGLLQRSLTRRQIDGLGLEWGARAEFRMRGLVGLMLHTPAA
ncbi:class I SAM-dependent methyltransferase [Streptomyces sp. bgisy060]|uniref:class I SAM-dependent methyltransferase n=1 Tax=Streptomyces sp. bgisy060 TaxID=3413775 RepID=UPI003EBE6D1E